MTPVPGEASGGTSDACLDVVATVLARLVDRRGTDALSWADASTAVPGAAPELHIGAASAVLRVGGHAVRIDPDGLPLTTNAVVGLSVVGLHLLPAVDAAFAQLRRVLRPAATLVVVVPSASMRSAAELRTATLLRAVRRGPWPHREALDGMGWLLAAADFSVIGDDRVSFALPLPDVAAAHAAVRALPAAGLWPPGLDPATRTELADAIAKRAGPGVVLPVPLRRLVARR